MSKDIMVSPNLNYFSRNQKIAIKNFYDMLKPGGILIIDHRNDDEDSSACILKRLSPNVIAANESD